MRWKPLALSSVALSGLALAAVQASAATAPPIQASGAWSRAVPAGLHTGVVYLTLDNRGGAEDRLVAAESPVSADVSLHRSSLTGGVMTMEAVKGGIALPPGQAVTLQPGGYHLMLDGLKTGLKAGARYPLTLRFAHAAPRTVQVQVRGPGAPMSGMTMR